MTLSAQQAPQAQPNVLVDCPNYGYVLGPTGPKRTKAVVPADCVTQQQFTNKPVAMFEVWDFDDDRGEGCESCYYTGQVAVYQRRDVSPYLRLYRCPHC